MATVQNPSQTAEPISANGAANGNAALDAAPAKKRNPRFAIILGVLLVAGSAFGISKYLHGQKHEETDDAQVEANIAPVIPRVAGYIDRVFVKDNQRVRRGDTLAILDARDMAVRVAQAEASLAAAQSSLGVAEANTEASRAAIGSSRAAIGTAEAQIEAARVRVRRASQDYQRYSALIKDHSITQQQFEQAEAEKQSADRQLQVLVEQRDAASAQTATVASQSAATSRNISVAGATIRARQADLDAAKLQLSYTVITAPADGFVSRVQLQPGQAVQAGQGLFNIVLDNSVWVIANFKETQLQKMREGQRVTVGVDAFPGRDLEGKLTSFSPATGARFSLLPPDNASGNFVKVVQRVPVRIDFNPGQAEVKGLRAGMNVAVDVHVAE